MQTDESHTAERAAGDALEPPQLLFPVPGTRRRRRFWFRIDWELISCGLHGHEIVGADAAVVREVDANLVREENGFRWCRCLRCEAWVPVRPPSEPARQYVPSTDEIEVPVRGRRLRDRYVLRLIVIDRAIRGLLFASLTVAIFLFEQHRSFLHKDYLHFLNDFQIGRGGVFGDIDKLFTISTVKLDLIGAAIALYTALLFVEAVGLWNARRWAEYLTLVETAVFIPFECYELTSSVSTFKVGALALNIAILLYLLLAHRLFGLRGGRQAAIEAYGAEG